LGLTDNEMCVCGDIQTMSHIVDSCLLTKHDSGLQRLHTTQKSTQDRNIRAFTPAILLNLSLRHCDSTLWFTSR